MDFYNHSYYRTSKNVMRLIGRWPYQGRWEGIICSFVLIFLGTSQFIAEIFGVMVYFNDKNVVLESISPFIIDVIMASKYINTIFRKKIMMKLLNCLKDDWTVCTNEEEKRIFDKYASIGQLVIYGYLVVVYITTAVFITEPLIPKWINYIFQLNETIPNKYPVPIYWYIIDMEGNFYQLLCYEAICIFAIVTITVAHDSMFIIFLQHACALFTLVQHQLRNLVNEKSLKENWHYSKQFRKTNNIQYDYYVMCIKNHKRAIEFAELLEDMYVWSFGVVIGSNMLIMSVTAVQLAIQSQTIQQTIKYLVFTITELIHLFFICYLSQLLTDKSNAVQEHIINSKWYEMSVKAQKLVVMVTLRSQKACKLTAGKFVILSMETFGVIIKASVSYFTMMVSMQ